MSLVVLGKFRIERSIGGGVAGSVYRGRVIDSERAVAVKEVRRDLGWIPVVGAASHRMLQAAANVRHPALGTLHAIAEEDGRTLVISDWVDGEALSEVTEFSAGKLPLAKAVVLFVQILDGLRVAHTAGLVHGDIKPENVLIPRGGGVQRASLVDFGVAAVLADTGVGRLGDGLVPNLDQRAPEQLQDPAVLTPAVDIYAVGALLHSVLGGTPPFAFEDVSAVIEGHLRRPPRPLRELDPEVPAGLEALVLRALAKDPRQRFASAADMREALLAFATEGDKRKLTAPPAPPKKIPGSGNGAAERRPETVRLPVAGPGADPAIAAALGVPLPPSARRPEPRPAEASSAPASAARSAPTAQVPDPTPHSEPVARRPEPAPEPVVRHSEPTGEPAGPGLPPGAVAPSRSAPAPAPDAGRAERPVAPAERPAAPRVAPISAAPKKSGSKLWIWLLVVLVVAVCGAAAVLFVMKKNGSGSSGEAVASAAAGEDAGAASDEGAADAGEAKEEEAPPKAAASADAGAAAASGAADVASAPKAAAEPPKAPPEEPPAPTPPPTPPPTAPDAGAPAAVAPTPTPPAPVPAGVGGIAPIAPAAIGPDDEKRAVELNSKGYDAYKKGHPADALEFYKKAVAANPNEPRHWYNAACIFAMLNKPAESVKYLEGWVARLDGATPAAVRDKLSKDRDFDRIRNGSTFRAFLVRFE